MSVDLILYSFVRCPYAIRARMALVQAGVQVCLREVDLKQKPTELLTASPKGTVPVLVLPSGEVIDESIDVVAWAFDQCPQVIVGPLDRQLPQLMRQLQDLVIPALMRYKYPERYEDVDWLAQKAIVDGYLSQLNQLLSVSDSVPLAFNQADALIFPMVRQYYKVDMSSFEQLPYKALHAWFFRIYESDAMQRVMVKVAPWAEDQVPVYL